MTRKRHIENVNPKSSYRDLGNNQIEELLPGVFNKNTELTNL